MEYSIFYQNKNWNLEKNWWFTLSHELMELEKEETTEEEEDVVWLLFEMTMPSVSTFELNKIDGATYE